MGVKDAKIGKENGSSRRSLSPQSCFDEPDFFHNNYIILVFSFCVGSTLQGRSHKSRSWPDPDVAGIRGVADMNSRIWAEPSPRRVIQGVYLIAAMTTTATCYGGYCAAAALSRQVSPYLPSRSEIAQLRIEQRDCNNVIAIVASALLCVTMALKP